MPGFNEQFEEIETMTRKEDVGFPEIARELNDALVEEECLEKDGTQITVKSFDEPSAVELAHVSDLERRIEAAIADPEMRDALKEILAYAKGPTIVYSNKGYPKYVFLAFRERLSELSETALSPEDKEKYARLYREFMTNRLRKNNIIDVLSEYDETIKEKAPFAISKKTADLALAIDRAITVRPPILEDADTRDFAALYEEEIKKLYDNMDIEGRRELAQATVDFALSLAEDAVGRGSNA